MAMGAYRGPGEIHRPVHAGSGRATVGMPGVADIAGMFGESFKGVLKAGNTWYQGLIDTGKALQGAGVAANRIQDRFQRIDEAETERANRLEASEARTAY